MSYLYGKIIRQKLNQTNGYIKSAEITHCSATCRAAKKYHAGTGYGAKHTNFEMCAKYLLYQVSYGHRTYDRNLSDCIKRRDANET